MTKTQPKRKRVAKKSKPRTRKPRARRLKLVATWVPGTKTIHGQKVACMEYVGLRPSI